ncbi:MAG TPA: hypothetical protein VNJ04_19645 [Gemmatimonadaceae bacterium]|nr:hypothetical protein [Gemmatimonadaceae bacterium]
MNPAPPHPVPARTDITRLSTTGLAAARERWHPNVSVDYFAISYEKRPIITAVEFVREANRRERQKRRGE